MRNMSFFLTTKQYRDGSKRVTRRLGWADLKPGDRFMGVRKSQGLKRGEKVRRLGASHVISNRRERLDAITPVEVALEGFPGMTPAEFVRMFCKHMGCRPSKRVNRIEFVRLFRFRAERTNRKRGT
jgi:hypothetical protein